MLQDHTGQKSDKRVQGLPYCTGVQRGALATQKIFFSFLFLLLLFVQIIYAGSEAFDLAPYFFIVQSPLLIREACCSRNSCRPRELPDLMSFSLGN